MCNYVYSPLTAILSRKDTFGTVAMDRYQPISFPKRVCKARLQSRNITNEDAHKAEGRSTFQRPQRCNDT